MKSIAWWQREGFMSLRYGLGLRASPTNHVEREAFKIGRDRYLSAVRLDLLDEVEIMLTAAAGVKICERCHEEALEGERFCDTHRSEVIRELEEAGYLEVIDDDSDDDELYQLDRELPISA